MPHNIKSLELGTKMEDGSYYMGVSPTTRTRYYLFLENATDTIKKTADIMSFDEGTTLLQDSYASGKTLNGHRYSQYQLHDDIEESYNEGTPDGGLRRFTMKEWQNTYMVLVRSGLKKLALEICEDPWVQSSLDFPPEGGDMHNIQSSMYMSKGRIKKGCVLVGRSDPDW